MGVMFDTGSKVSAECWLLSVDLIWNKCWGQVDPGAPIDYRVMILEFV